MFQKGEEISDPALKEIKTIYPDSFKHWDDDRSITRHWVTLTEK